MDPATGGPCQGIRNSIPELQRLNIYHEVVCLDDPSLSFIKNDPFPVIALGAGKGPWRYSSRLLPWLQKNIHRFDVLIIHGLWLYPSYAVTKAIRLFKKRMFYKVQKTTSPKVFIMPHGMLDPYFQRAAGRKSKAIRNKIYWELIEGRVVNNADGLLFTSEEELILARQPFRPYKPKKEINIGYGIKAPPAFSIEMKNAFLETCPDLSNSQYFLFLSRIHEKKGVDILLKAYLDLLANGAYDVLPKLVIAGPGIETHYGQRMLEMVNAHAAFKNRVYFSGLLLDDAKWGAYYGCEAFILPSHQENFGIVVTEALACRKPVLTTEKVNIWREITAYKAGFISDDNIEGIYELFNRWMRLTKEEKVAMGSNSKECFEKNFTAKSAAMRLRDALK